MQISDFSDYALRILMYLAVSGERMVTTREISKAYGLSFDHSAKVSQLLAREGYLISVRGRGGGVRLARKPEDISIGSVMRLTEKGSGLVECMRPGPSKCILSSLCGLAPILAGADEAFFAELDKKTLADTLSRKRQIKEILQLEN